MGKYGVIYKIRNKVNNKIYFGQTIEKDGFDRRYKNNLYEYTHNKHLKNSIKKYGMNNFEIDKEFDIAYSKEELDKLEDIYIKIYNTTNRKYGYNKQFGGDNGKLTNETKNKISKTLIYKYNIGEIIAWNKGKNMPNETKNKLSKVKKGKYKGKNNPNYGNKGSKNTISIPIILLNTEEVFECTREGAKKYNTYETHITRNCRGRSKSAGKHPITGEKLVWMYYDEYLEHIQEADVS